MRTLRSVVLVCMALAAGCGDDDRRVTVDGGRDGGAVGEGGTDAGRRDSSMPPPGDGGEEDTGPGDGGMIDMDAPMDMDAGMEMDAGMDIDAPMGGDAGPPTSTQIAAARAAADGATSVLVEGAYVTYLKPAIGVDPAGFFIQAERLGPALFVAIDPATLTPVPAVGDVVTFTVTEMGTAGMLRQATMISGWTVLSSGTGVSFLRQDVSAATDLVTNVTDYESELITLAGTISGDFAGAGSGHVAAQLDTASVMGDPNLRLRVPVTLHDALDLARGCTLMVNGTPLWRFNAAAQVSGWVPADITVTGGCPAPRVVRAIAVSSTTVVVTFDRHINPASVLAGGSQFTFSGGLTAVAAMVTGTGTEVTITTTAQTPAASYTVTVASSVRDLLGAGVDVAANSAMFLGFLVPAIVRINELNANVTSGCDLIELRVVSGGTMDGYQLWERIGPLLTFSGLVVATNDYIVVHLNSASTTCNPTASAGEIGSPTSLPAALHPQNYDSAYDWYSSDSGLTNTDNVFTLFDALGGIVDAVFVTDDPTGTAAADTETQAARVAAAGQWTMVGGGVPAGGFVDDNFNMHAVQDLNATGVAASGTTIQRTDNTDTNTLVGWTTGPGLPATWGANNVGQTSF